jgi:hypothetical protein
MIREKYDSQSTERMAIRLSSWEAAGARGGVILSHRQER